MADLSNSFFNLKISSTFVRYATYWNGLLILAAILSLSSALLKNDLAHSAVYTISASTMPSGAVILLLISFYWWFSAVVNYTVKKIPATRRELEPDSSLYARLLGLPARLSVLSRIWAPNGTASSSWASHVRIAGIIWIVAVFSPGAMAVLGNGFIALAIAVFCFTATAFFCAALFFFMRSLMADILRATPTPDVQLDVEPINEKERAPTVEDIIASVKKVIKDTKADSVKPHHTQPSQPSVPPAYIPSPSASSYSSAQPPVVQRGGGWFSWLWRSPRNESSPQDPIVRRSKR